MKPRILITGSNGLLGQKLIDLFCINTDYEFLATSRVENRVSEFYPTLNFQVLDITDSKNIEEVFSKFKPTHVINTAAITNIDYAEEHQEECWEINVEAVRKLTLACKKHNARFIHLSTDFVFDGKNGPYIEDDELNPISYYGRSKQKSERITLKASDLNVVVRTVLVYGITRNMSRSNIILWVKNSLEKRESIKVVTDQWRTPTLAEDLAIGCKLIVDNNETGVFHISGQDYLSPFEMAIQTAEYFNLDKSLILKVDASSFSQVGKRPPKTGFDISKAIEKLKFSPRSFQEGIAILEQQIQDLS